MKNSWMALVLAGAMVAAVGISAPLHATEDQTPAMAMQSEGANLSVQQEIQSKLDDNLNFGETTLTVMVNGDTVVLAGNARDIGLHGRALDFVKSFAGSRQIVDRSTIEQVYRTAQ
jgi:osmotically-inducible protein OsmY